MVTEYDESLEGMSEADLKAIIKQQAAALAKAKTTIASQQAQICTANATIVKIDADLNGALLYIDNSGGWIPYKKFLDGCKNE
jgi:hypothetical protein